MNQRSDSKLVLYDMLRHTRALGPFLRFAIWVQGCVRRCPGCMTPDAAPFEGGTAYEIDGLAERIVDTGGIEGITISGGEPFEQAEGLTRLIDRVRSRRDLGVIVYTGYTLDSLLNRTDCGKSAALLDKIDLLVDGPYIKELDDGLSLRGSSNQEIYCFTGRYAGLADQIYGKPIRNVEIHILDHELFLAGIPGAEMLKNWKERRMMA